MPLTLVASGQNSGTLGVITSSGSSKPIPAGAIIVAFASAAVANNAFSGLADNSGLGNVYNLSNMISAGINESALLGLAVANGIVPAGTVWTWTFAAGTPGGRMFSVGYFDDSLGSPSVFDKNPSPVFGTAASGSISTAGGLVVANELVIVACAMRGLAAGADNIVFDGLINQADVRNHTGTTTAYQGWGYRYVNSQNDVSDSASFLSASDTFIIGMQTVKLATPSAPAPLNYIPNSIVHPAYHGV